MQTNSSAAQQTPAAANCFQNGEKVNSSFVGETAIEEIKTDKSPEQRSPINETLQYASHRISGGAKHTGVIVETPGLANVAQPQVTYRPYLPRILSENGLISGFQFERIIYAGQAHKQRLARLLRLPQ